jgi:RNA polymerase sigma factor (sigma-70 family)
MSRSLCSTPAKDVELRAALAALYVSHRRKLHSFAWHLVGNDADAEDAVHDAFVEVLARGEPLKGDPLPYLRAVVRRACRDCIRQRSAEVPLETADVRLRPAADDD